MSPLSSPLTALLALGVEAACGYPDWLYRRISHPVVWIGAMIGTFERRWNNRRRLPGVLLVLALVLVAAGAGWGVGRIAALVAGGWVALVLIASTALAQRSLYAHVMAVARPLHNGDLPAARAAVSLIVGRDTAAMTDSAIARAAIESLAESFSDGVVAPAFWLAVAGLPGAFIYKAINTADSMVGHRERRYRAFGWAAARMDDGLNIIPARIAGALLCIAGGGGWRVMLADAPGHASPNAGWPEAAMAGALHIQLGGPVAYDGLPHHRPLFNPAGLSPAVADVDRALHLYRRACLLLWGILACIVALPLVMKGQL